MKLGLLGLLCISLVFALGFSACTANERLPAELVFNFQWAETPDVGSSFTMEGGELVIGELNFDGTREVGSEFSFRVADNQGIIVDLRSNEINPALRYNLPQGIYNRIRISFELLSREGRPSVWVEGKYKNSANQESNFRLEYSANLLLDALAQHENDTSLPLVVKESEISDLWIILNPYNWLQLVTERDMNEAELSEWSGKTGILISSTQNELIYDKVVRRVGQSVQIMYK
jgi:hypothetical protein